MKRNGHYFHPAIQFNAGNVILTLGQCAESAIFCMVLNMYALFIKKIKIRLYIQKSQESCTKTNIHMRTNSLAFSFLQKAVQHSYVYQNKCIVYEH